MAQPELPIPARSLKQGARLLVLALALGAGTGVYWRQPADLVCTTAGMGWIGRDPERTQALPDDPLSTTAPGGMLFRLGGVVGREALKFLKNTLRGYLPSHLGDLHQRAVD
jgi:hypothetical protein